MRCSLVVLVVLLVMPCMARARFIPSYRMDFLTPLSGAIVLCDEQDVQIKTVEHENRTERRTLVHHKVVQTFKGAACRREETPGVGPPLFPVAATTPPACR